MIFGIMLCNLWNLIFDLDYMYLFYFNFSDLIEDISFYGFCKIYSFEDML